MRIRIDKKSGSTFPDGQAIYKFDESQIVKEGSSKIINLEYIWDWSTIQLLIGAKKYWEEQPNIQKIFLYMPYMFGQRADRKFGLKEPRYFKDVIAHIINGLNFDKVFVIDPHSDVVENCINNVLIANRLKLVEDWMKKYEGQRVCLVVPDAGAIKKSYDIEHLFDSVLYANKRRDNVTHKVNVVALETLPEADIYLIVDDICDGGATFNELNAEILKQKSNAVVSLAVTHGIFSKGLDVLRQNFKMIHTTNSLNFDRISEFNIDVFDIWK